MQVQNSRQNDRQLAHYFEYSSHGIEVLGDGLEEITFGEYLVEQTDLTREQLLTALQLQDQHPDKRIGECVAALGYLPYETIREKLRAWNALDVVVV